MAAGAQVDHGDGTFVGVDKEVHDMVSEETTAANDEDFSERLLLRGGNRCHCA